MYFSGAGGRQRPTPAGVAGFSGERQKPSSQGSQVKEYMAVLVLDRVQCVKTVPRRCIILTTQGGEYHTLDLGKWCSFLSILV